MNSGHQSYLRGLAKLFFQARGKVLYRYRFFFTSKRAGQFFCHYLQQESGSAPMILPQVTTLPSFLRGVLSRPDEDVNNELLLIFHLYHCYSRRFEHTDFSFDSFYDIGHQLLADFNDIDNQLKDVDKIFQNMDLLDELTVSPLEYMEEGQIEAMQRFVVGDLKKDLSRQYSAFWQELPHIYTDFKETLRSEGLYYNGMLMRDITEGIASGQIELFRHDDKVNVFVGFNGLSTCEKQILRHFCEERKTLFYWDYDSDLLKKRFTDKSREDSKIFPEPTGELAYHRNKEIKDTPELEIISIPSKLGQAAYIAQEIIPQIEIAPLEPNTAIILPDESQLSNLLSHLSTPEMSKAVSRLNVTMGFPVKYLPVIAKLIHLLTLQRNAYKRGINAKSETVWRREEVIDLFGLQLIDEVYDTDLLLKYGRHRQYDWSKKLYYTTSDLSSKIGIDNPELIRLFYLHNTEQNNLIHNTLAVIASLQRQHAEDKSLCMGLHVVSELLTEIQLSLDRFVMKHPEAAEYFTFEILYDIIYTTLTRVKVPFAGEPLEGVQVMGILEARSIDFENIIIMDAGEGILPTKSRKYGLITQSIRQANQLPTYQWQDNIRAYNFFHMIARAKKVFALYDSRRTERASGEPSRYLRLLTHIYGVDATYRSGYFPLIPLTTQAPELNWKRIEVYRTEITGEDKNLALSPSAINNYLSCPRKFYYQNILKLREPDELTEVLEKNDRGTIIHKAMELLYDDLKGIPLTVEMLTHKLESIPSVVRRAYQEIYGSDSKSGYFDLYNEVICSEVRNAVNMDIEEIKAGHRLIYLAGEYPVRTKYRYDEDAPEVNIKGYIDRIDLLDDTLRLVDYKTGGDSFKFNLTNSFLTESAEKVDRAAIQLLTYCELVMTDGLELGGKRFLPRKMAPSLFKPGVGEKGFLNTEIEDESLETTGKKKKLTLVVDDYHLVRDEFRNNLNQVLKQIMEEAPKEDSDEEFAPNNLKSYNCNYCAARNLCHKAKTSKY